MIDPTAETDPTAESVRKAIRRLTIATVILAALLVAAIVVVWLDSASKRSTLHADEERTTSALCALRLDLQDRVVAGENFLLEHPDGIPGISASQIRTSLDGQRRTITALAILQCPPA